MNFVFKKRVPNHIVSKTMIRMRTSSVEEGGRDDSEIPKRGDSGEKHAHAIPAQRDFQGCSAVVLQDSSF